MVFNRAFDLRPALIVRCGSGSDVARTLDFGQKHDLPPAVRGGGHSRLGYGMRDGGVVIDLSTMKRVEVDTGKHVVRAEAGTLVRDLDEATRRFGLATTSGGCPISTTLKTSCGSIKTSSRISFATIGTARSFRISVTDARHFLNQIEANELSLGRDQSRTIRVELAVPAGIAAGTSDDTVVIVATGITGASTSNSGVVDFAVSPSSASQNP